MAARTDGSGGFSTLICEVEVAEVYFPRRPSYRWQVSPDDRIHFRSEHCATRGARGSFDQIIQECKGSFAPEKDAGTANVTDDTPSEGSSSDESITESRSRGENTNLHPFSTTFSEPKSNLSCSLDELDNSLLSWRSLTDFLGKSLERQYIWSMAISEEQEAELAQITAETLHDDLAQNSDWAQRNKLTQDIAFAYRKGLLNQTTRQAEESLEAEASSLESTLLELGSPQATASSDELPAECSNLPSHLPYQSGSGEAQGLLPFLADDVAPGSEGLEPMNHLLLQEGLSPIQSRSTIAGGDSFLALFNDAQTLDICCQPPTIDPPDCVAAFLGLDELDMTIQDTQTCDFGYARNIIHPAHPLYHGSFDPSPLSRQQLAWNVMPSAQVNQPVLQGPFISDSRIQAHRKAVKRRCNKRTRGRSAVKSWFV